MAATNNYTRKSMEALARAQQIAVEYQHMQADEEHLILALIENGQELIPQLLEKAGYSVSTLKASIQDAIERMPRVTGSGREADKIYISQDLDKALAEANAAAKNMGMAYSKAWRIMKEDLRRINADVTVSQTEYDEITAIKPMFLICEYRDEI